MPLFARRAQYRLQHRYQDSGWENSDDGTELYAADQLGDAVREAEQRSRHALLWGMCRVIELSSKMIIVEFSAGHPLYRVTVANGRVMLIEGDSAATEHSEQRVEARPDEYDYTSPYPVPVSMMQRGFSSSLSYGSQYPDIERVTAPGPDLPPIDNRAPRGIRLRNKESEAD